MKVFTLIRYFFYLGINWNWPLAFYTIISEIKGEKKYGLYTTGFNELQSLKKKGTDITHATTYMPASYPILEKIFNYLPVQQLQHFVDIGCGKGRALCVAACHGFKKVSGVDFSETFCKNANDHLKTLQKKIPELQFCVIQHPAEYYCIPADADCIFIFNPFDDIILKKVLENIELSLRQHPRKMYFVYANPVHKSLLTEAGFAEIFSCRYKRYFEAAILCK